MRSPFYFLQTMKRVIAKHPEWKGKISFHHVGETPFWVSEMLNEIDPGISFTSHGYLNQGKVAEAMAGFDLLLATSEKVLNDEHYCLPSKLFTYLQSGKPVIGFVTKGIQKDFIERSGGGMTFDPDDTEGSALHLEEILVSGINMKLNREYLEQFNSKYTNAQFLEIVKSVSTSDHMLHNNASY